MMNTRPDDILMVMFWAWGAQRVPVRVQVNLTNKRPPPPP